MLRTNNTFEPPSIRWFMSLVLFVSHSLQYLQLIYNLRICGGAAGRHEPACRAFGPGLGVFGARGPGCRGAVCDACPGCGQPCRV